MRILAGSRDWSHCSNELQRILLFLVSLVFSWVLGYFLSLPDSWISKWVTVHFDSGLIHQNQVSYKWWKSLLCVVWAAWRRRPHAKSLLVARQPCRRNRFSATGSLFSRGGIYYHYPSSPDNRSRSLAEKNSQSFLFSFLFLITQHRVSGF